MERLTERTNCGVANLAYPKSCYFQDGAKDQIAVSAYRQLAIERLAAYEDTGLEPDDIRATVTPDELVKLASQMLGVQPDQLRELVRAEKAGRLVVLPCKDSDKLYVVGEKRIIRCDICETYLDDKKGPEYLVSFDCDSDCDGCPFNNWSQGYSGEWSCDGEYGQSVVVGSEIGKTVFLTREEAEAALEGGKDK